MKKMQEDDLYENEHKENWIEDNIDDLQEEFLKRCDQADIPLDDDMPDWFNDNDEFHIYCDEQYKDADHDIYPPR